MRTISLAALALAALTAAAATPDPLAAARLREASPRGDNGLGFPRIANRLRSTGEVRFKVIFVDFSDAPAGARTPGDTFKLISPDAESFFAAMSYGRLKIVLDPHLQWLRMGKHSTSYGWPPSFPAHRAYIQEALDLAVAAGVDFAASDSFIVLANPDAPAFTNGPAFTPLPGSGVKAGGKVFENGATSGRDLLLWGYKWFNLEIGHALSLVDLYAYAGRAHRFVGEFSVMGLISGQAPELLAWERWHLGWLDDHQVVCPARGTSEITLTPVETAGGLKLIVVPTGRTTAVVIEHRSPLGYDAKLTRGGPLVYFIDTAIRSGEGVIKVLPIDDADARKLAAPLQAGQTLTHAGVVVKCLSTEGANTTVQVTRM